MDLPHIKPYFLYGSGYLTRLEPDAAERCSVSGECNFLDTGWKDQRGDDVQIHLYPFRPSSNSAEMKQEITSLCLL